MVVEAEEAPGVAAGGLIVGLAIGRDGQLADLLGRPFRRRLGQRASVSGLATWTRGFIWSKESLPWESASEIFGQDFEFLGRRHPFAGRGRRDRAPLHQPRHHGGGAVDPPGLAAIELGHGGEEADADGRDRSMMLGHARDERVGAARDGVGSGTVAKGGCVTMTEG